MKNILLHVILNLGLDVISVCQVQSFDGINYRLSENTPSSIYEGQFIVYETIIENNTSEIKNYHRIPESARLYIKDVINNELIMPRVVSNYKPKMTQSFDSQLERSAPTVVPFKPLDYRNYTESLKITNFGNSKLSDFLNDVEININSELKYPLFFKEGKYEIMNQCTLRPTANTLDLYYNFEVKKIPKKQKKQQEEYFRAIEKLVNNRLSLDVENLILKDSLSLYNQLINHPENIYSGDIFHLLTNECDNNSYPIVKELLNNNKCVFKLFEVYPKILKYHPNYTAIHLFESYSIRFKSFIEEGLILDQVDYFDKYLQSLENASPQLVTFLIIGIKESTGIEKKYLRNYSAEKIEKERKE